MFNSAVQIYRIIEKHYLPGFSIRMHSHNYFHYIYVISGQGELNIVGTDGEYHYELSESELHLAPLGVKHDIRAKDGCGLETIEVKFVPSNKAMLKRLMSLPYRLKDIDPKVGHTLKDLIKEASNKEVFYEDLINLKFTEVILYMLRIAAGMEKKNEINEQEWSFLYCIEDNDIFTQVIRYMKENLDKRIDISDMAKMTGFSESYFCTIFKENFSLTPGQFLNNLRLFKAKDIIMHSDLNITQISEKLGFNSVHYFSRFFKKMTGMSPNEYMNKVGSDAGIKLISTQNL